MDCQVELTLRTDAANGESPTWSAAEQELYWIDVKRPSLHRFDPETGEDRLWPMPCEIGAFALEARPGRIIAALRSGIVRLDLESAATEPLADPPYDPATHRFNDGKCDMHGRFWIGTIAEPPLGQDEQQVRTPGPLCRFDIDERLTLLPTLSAVIGNGLAFSRDGRWLYFTHTKDRTVFRYPLHRETGLPGKGEVFVRFDQGQPDGSALDIEGGYWCALFGAAKVVRVSPDGRIGHQIKLPVSQPTMCAFGGKDLATLYVTTARHGLPPAALVREPLAGSLFHCRPGVAGFPAQRFGADQA